MILFCHGKEGSPEGAKVQALRAAGFQVGAPDLRGRTLEEQIEVISDWIARVPRGESLGVVGSSMGAIAAAFAVEGLQEDWEREPCDGLVLLAPAWHLADGLWPDAVVPTALIHGTKDEVADISISRVWAVKENHPTKAPVRMIEVEDGHRLHESLNQVVVWAGNAQNGNIGWGAP